MELDNYRAKLIRVIDGDTISLELDVGLNIILKKCNIRMARINAPEVGTEFAQKSIEFLINLITNKELIVNIKNNAKDKYGRYLGELYVKDNEWVNVSNKMLDNAMAVLYKGNIDEEFIY
jgi:micrococcal nuclease